MMRYRIKLAVLFLLLGMTRATAQSMDTLKVMTYNVLGYGDGCQGGIDQLHQHLRTIITFSRPDILGLVKMASVKTSPSDIYGIAPYGFPDSILSNALNAALPGRYSFCPFTNTAYSDKISMLFYNREKLGYVATTLISSAITDFDLYKLYYKDPNLAVTKDTTFLYILLNHTQSGNDPSLRNTQIAKEIAGLTARFYHLPNLINMGDFNTRSSLESGYYSLTEGGAQGFRFSDPPFSPDGLAAYPANWDAGAASFSAFLTTSTRALANVPNTCGTDGGAKGWYDHILLAPWLLDGRNYIQYIPGSYHTVGNDGHRFGISINDHTVVTNTAAPPGVIEALFQFSNKYPVMLSLAIAANATGSSPADPEKIIPVGLQQVPQQRGDIKVSCLPDGGLWITVPDSWSGKKTTLEVYDLNGKKILEHTLTVNGSQATVPFNAAPGIYAYAVYDALSHVLISGGKMVR